MKIIKNKLEEMENQNSTFIHSEKEINLKDLMNRVNNSEKEKETQMPKKSKEIQIPENKIEKEIKKVTTIPKVNSSEDKKKKIEEMFKKMKNFTT
jgi:hypothetical protein